MRSLSLASLILVSTLSAPDRQAEREIPPLFIVATVPEQYEQAAIRRAVDEQAQRGNAPYLSVASVEFNQDSLKSRWVTLGRQAIKIPVPEKVEVAPGRYGLMWKDNRLGPHKLDLNFETDKILSGFIRVDGKVFQVLPMGRSITLLLEVE